MQGGEIIDGVIAQAGSQWPVREHPIVNTGKVALDNRIWIGTTKSELLKLLGKPSTVDGASLIYDFDEGMRDPKVGVGDIVGRLAFEIYADKVSRLFVTKDTSFLV